MKRDDLKQTLKQPYDRATWSGMLRAVFGEHVRINAEAQRLPAEDDCIQSIAQIGDVMLSDGKNLAIIEVEVGDDVNLLRNRVGLRNRVAKFIDQDRAHGVLAVFSSARPEYRFTFTAREILFDEELGMVEKETATKRFTYVLGPGESCTTAAQRFERLSEKQESLILGDVVEAFSVEKLNKEFFHTYKEHYERFCAHLLSEERKAQTYALFQIGKAKTSAEQTRLEKPVRDFVKRLLGRIVFLHFLQKKGWMGCPADREEWTGGDPDFLHHYFQHSEDKTTFHSTRLLPLFYEALNRPGRKHFIFAPTGTRIPYLNGGLFEQAGLDEAQIDFPPELFADLLDFFRQFNFTIDENDPDEHEVGIDPEMLGHIFENLLEDNKDKGAYYTPKAIVHYMCQQSLLYYLLRHLGESEEARAALEYLVRSKQTGEGTPHAAYIRAHAARIEELIDAVKVCDPAIGSGAFPIGILQEIFWIKITLDLILNQPEQLAEVKRGIIQNSIYGVDKDAGAVDIARLRFWLSLVVDETEPRPLPNLDYKIMQGDSLVESFEGISMDYFLDPYRTAKSPVPVAIQNELNFSSEDEQKEEKEHAEKITSLFSEYFTAESPERKLQIHQDIDRHILQYYQGIFQELKLEWDIELHQQKVSLRDKQKKLAKYNPSKSEQRRIDFLEKSLAGIEQKKKKLQKLEAESERPFFLWHLYFQDVFEQGGFDIVIANPPYVRQEVIKDYKPLLESEGYDCFTGTADLFVYFYERSVKMLNDQGVLTFITSNKYFRSGYGENLRAFLARELSLRELLDFGDAPVFDAIAYASILIGTKTPPPQGHALKAWTWQRGEKIGQVARVMAEKAFPIEQHNLTPDGWGLERPEVFALLKKLRDNGTPLGEYVQGRFYYGIKTGLNEAFVIDQATRDRLVAEHPGSEKVLKPFLRGRDVKRWSTHWAGYYLIKIESSQNKEHPWSGRAPKDAEAKFRDTYPAIHNWFQSLKEKTDSDGRNLWDRLFRRSDQGTYYWELRACAYWEEFDHSKIILGRFMDKPSYGFNQNGAVHNDALYFIPGISEPECCVLNSSVTWFFLTLICTDLQNGYIQALRQNQLPIPIPDIDDRTSVTLRDLAQQAVATTGPELESVEAEINRIVYGLFELTPEEIRLIESTIGKGAEPEIAGEHGKTRDKDSFFRRLRELAAERPYLSFERLKEDIREDALVEKDDTLYHYLAEALDAGIVQSAGRGWYTRHEQEAKLSPLPLEELSALLEARFPLLPHYIWSPLQFNPWLHNQLGRVPSFVYVDADGLEDMADFLIEQGWDVNVNPGKREGIRTGSRNRDVVLRPVRRELSEQEPTLETALVDLFHENERFGLVDPTEFKQMVRNILSNQRVNLASLIRKLGDKKKSVTDILDKESVQYLGIL